VAVTKKKPGKHVAQELPEENHEQNIDRKAEGSIQTKNPEVSEHSIIRTKRLMASEAGARTANAYLLLI